MYEKSSVPPSIESMYVVPRGDPYRQARQLLMLGLIRGRWLLLNGFQAEEPAWLLAQSVDNLVHRGLRSGNQRMVDYRPLGTVIFAVHRIVQYAEYRTWDDNRRVLQMAYLKAEDNPYKQVREIVFSGIAAKACIVLYGSFDNVQNLLRPLHETILRGSYNGVRIVEPRPLGIYVLTSRSLFKFADYSRFTHKT